MTARRIARKNLQAVFSQVRAAGGSAALAGWVMGRASRRRGSWWQWRGNRCMRGDLGLRGRMAVIHKAAGLPR